MTLRHLSVFICVCDTGSMTETAKKLHIAQPSVSQTITELEKYYNVRLFERLGRKLFISPAGQLLLTYARHIVNLSRQTEDAMRELNHTGSLRIGASVTVGTCVLNDIIEKFIRQNPECKIVSIVNNTKFIEEMLLTDQLDAGVVEGQIHARGLLCEPFMNDELVLICGRHHYFAGRDKIKPIELNNMEFIIREEGSGTRELFELVMANHGIGWHTAGVYNNAEAIKNAVTSGLGISVMSRMAVRKEIERNELVIIKIEGISFPRKFNLVHHKNKYLSPFLQQLFKLCREYKN